MGEAVRDLVEPRGQQVRQLGGELAELLADVIGLDVDARGQALGGAFERAGRLGAGVAELFEEVAAALADGVDHGIAGASERERDVLALLRERARDPLGRVGDAGGDQLADRADVLGEPDVDAGDRAAHLLGLGDHGVALVGEILDQAADAQLVVVIGALQRRDLVVDQGFEFRGARERALHSVAHGGDFAADRLADADDRFLGDGLGLGEPHGSIGHGAADDAQLLGAADQVREQEQECDRHDQHGRKTVELQGDAVLADQLNGLGSELRHAEHDAGRDPADRKNSGDHIGPARRAALQGLEHAPDGLAVVVGGGRLCVLGGFRLDRRRLAEKDFLVSRRIAARPAAVFAGPVDRVGPWRRRRRPGRSRGFAVPETERILDRRQRCLGRILHFPGVVCHDVRPPSRACSHPSPRQNPPAGGSAFPNGDHSHPYTSRHEPTPARPSGHPIGLTDRMKPSR